LLILYADSNLRRTPYMMCQAFEELLSKRDFFPVISLLAAGMSVRENRIHMTLVQALRDAIAETRVEAGKRIDEILREEYAVQEGEINLLSKSLCDITLPQFEEGWWERSTYLQARKPESRFYLICKKPVPMRLNLTCRLHRPSLDNEPVSVIVNGCLIDEIMVSTNWSQHTIIISPEFLHDGMNLLVISWPEPLQSHDERIEEIIKNLERYDQIHMWLGVPEIYPTYGEVYALSAALHREPSVSQPEKEEGSGDCLAVPGRRT
jgi:hypothetical protein